MASAATLAHHPEDSSELMNALTSVGRASLSAGRLFEGHVNAVKVITLHAGDGRDAFLEEVAGGVMFGIWGADGRESARVRDGMLIGQKIFASGADVLDWMIVSVLDESAIASFILAQAIGGAVVSRRMESFRNESDRFGAL